MATCPLCSEAYVKATVEGAIGVSAGAPGIAGAVVANYGTVLAGFKISATMGELVFGLGKMKVARLLRKAAGKDTQELRDTEEKEFEVWAQRMVWRVAEDAKVKEFEARIQACPTHGASAK